MTYATLRQCQNAGSPEDVPFALDPQHRARRTTSRICYLGLSRWPNGPGDPRIFQKQLPALAEAGYKVVALITGRGEPYDLHGVCVKPMGWEGGLFRRWRHLYDVFRKGRAEQADCYFFGNFEIIPVAVMLKLLTGTRLVYDAMEHYPDMMRASRKVWRIIREPLAVMVDGIERASRSCMDLIITADEATMWRFRRGRPSEIIFNFPSLRVLDRCDLSLAEKLRKHYAGRRVITYVGGLGPDRGLREMIETIEIVRREFPQIVLQLLGAWQSTDLLREFEQRITSKGLQDFIELHGSIPQDSLGAYLRLSEIGLAPLEASPKHQKNIATKQFDYMCCGIPIVANDLAPFRAFTGQAKAGLIVDTSDPHQFARAIIRLLRDSKLAATLGRNGRRAIENGWNWETQADRLRAAFGKVLPQE